MKHNDLVVLQAQVLNVELKKKKEMLESFIYNCSHSIRSPVKSMEGLVNLLRKYPDVASTDDLDYAALLKEAARRIQTILFQFEELRLNAERPLNLKAIDLSKMVERVVEPFHPKLEEYGIELKMKINQKGQIHSDVVRMETILSELIANAIHFHDHEKQTREIAIYITASPSSCSIQVHDNGLGIRPVDLGRVFELFFRGNEHSPGSGLGLFIARQTAEKLKGTISVQSVMKLHTIFSLWIPHRIR